MHSGIHGPRWPVLSFVGAIAVFAFVACRDDRLPTRPGSPAERVTYNAVPDDPPEGTDALTWADISDPGNVLTNPPSVSGQVIWNTLYVYFNNGTTTSQKQALLDTLGADVIGGLSIGNPGAYHIRLTQAFPTAPDSSSGPLLRAEAFLRARGIVKLVLLDRLDVYESSYRMPVDSMGFRDWRLSVDSASGHRWAQEAVAAPFAWGCDTGSATTRIAVVDVDFHAIADLTPNVGSVHEYAPTGNPGFHGTAVASIIAASGNNHLGITGMMWSADLHLVRRDSNRTGNPTFGPIMGLDKAARSGARVINFSSGLQWLTTPTATKADSARVIQQRDVFQQMIDGLPPGADPLFVMASGNDSVDAWWAGMTALAADPAYRGRIVVVGATRLVSQGNQSMAAFSNDGSLVDVLAPGEKVVSLDKSGDTVYVSGTSFAAPFVSGTAGMMFNFDSRLSADSVRTLLIAGAVAGGKTASDGVRNIPITNAYAALRQVARRTGAPICGQRVWAENDNLYVRRDSNSSPEVLGALGEPAWGVAPYHSGHFIDYFSESGLFTYTFGPGGWGPTMDYTNTLTSGAYSSGAGFSHEWDAWINTTVMTGDGTNGVSADSERVYVVIENDSRSDTTFVEYAIGPYLIPDANGDSMPTKRVVAVSVAYPQHPSQRDTALVGIVRLRGTARDSTYSCMNDLGQPETCHNPRYDWMSDTTYLYKVSIKDSLPALTLVRELPDTIIYSLAFSEAGPTLISTMGGETFWSDAGGGGRTVTSCRVRFHGIRASSTVTDSLSYSDACYPIEYNYRSAVTLSSRRGRRPDVMSRRMTPAAVRPLGPRRPARPPH